MVLIKRFTNDLTNYVHIHIQLSSIVSYLISSIEARPACASSCWRGGVPGGLSGSLGGIHVGLLLSLGDVPLVTDSLVAEPVAHL